MELYVFQNNFLYWVQAISTVSIGNNSFLLLYTVTLDRKFYLYNK